MSDKIRVEVVYGLPEKQRILVTEVITGTSVETVIEQSGIKTEFPQIDLSQNKVGIWNRTCKLSDYPKDGDRIEIYRPLIADPKEARRQRAEKAKLEGRANKVTGAKMNT